MTETLPALTALETRLRAAVHAFAAGLAEASAPVFGASPRLVLARLAPDLSVEEADRPETLPTARRQALADRLRGEDARLARLARAADARYDLNRHIALRRLLRRIEAAGTQTPAPAHPASGRELNRRFAGRRPSPSRQPAACNGTGPAVAVAPPSFRKR